MRNVLEALRRVFAALANDRRRAACAVAAVAVPCAVLAVTLGVLGGLDQLAARTAVAVVNLDEGYTDAEGSVTQAGADFAASLEDSDELAWRAVGEGEAEAGLDDGTYALIVEIPADYSEKVASQDTASPERAEITIVSNDAQNPLATQEATSVLQQVQARLRADLGRDYVLSVLSDVKTQASKLSLTADGAVMLDQAYEALGQGNEAVTDGIQQVADAAGPLGQGLDAIAQGVDGVGAGATALGQGLVLLRDQGAAPMAAGLSGISEALDAVADGADQLG